MGNVQCCASDRFHEGKPPKKPKSKKKNKKKQKGNSEKTNGVGGNTVDSSAQKVTKVAEDRSERVAPQEAQAQSAPPPDDPVKKSQDSLNMTQPTDSSSVKSDSPRNETTAAARERFFGQVEFFSFLSIIYYKHDLVDVIVSHKYNFSLRNIRSIFSCIVIIY